MWIYTKRGKRRLFRKNFGDDLASAEELFHKALKAEKPYATLACVNMGFPPPVELRPRTVTKRGRVRGSRKIKTVRVEVAPLRELNHRGILWCPHCRQTRTFVFSRTAEVDGIHMDYPRYVCPICKISHRDYNVRRYNPTAAMHMDSSLAARQRAPRSTQRRRRRRARS